MTLRILATVQGPYGRRIVEHIRRQVGAGWDVLVVELPLINLPVLDEPEAFVPAGLPNADLLLHMGENQTVAQLIPAMAQVSGAGAVIAPVDHSHWIPPGLRRQLKRELEAAGRAIVFPEPFCSLTATDTDHPAVQRFGSRFGFPVLRVTPDASGTHIAGVEVLRGSPCGSSLYAAERMHGLDISEAVPQAGLICLHYPCLASMALENREGKIDTLMHLAGQLFNLAVERALCELLSQEGRP